MKSKTLMLLLLFAAVFFSCKEEAPPQPYSDYETLKNKLQDDPLVLKARSLLHENARLTGSFTPEEFAAIQSKVRSCGYYASEATIDDLKTCLSGHPNAEQFIMAQELTREYKEIIKSLKQQFPAFAQLTPEQRSSIIVRVTMQQTQELISDYQSKINK